MNKAFVALGIILLFAGVIAASASTMATEKSEVSPVDTASKAWEISGQYFKGEKLLFSFATPELDNPIPEYPLKIRVEVTGPQGSKTVFELEYKPTSLEDPTRLYLYNITVTLNEDGLTVSDILTEKNGGIVPYDGNYLANITTRRLWGPPQNLMLEKEVFHNEYPYLFVLPIGVPLAVVGGSLSFLSVRSSKRKLRSRTKKR